MTDKSENRRTRCFRDRVCYFGRQCSLHYKSWTKNELFYRGSVHNSQSIMRIKCMQCSTGQRACRFKSEEHVLL